METPEVVVASRLEIAINAIGKYAFFFGLIDLWFLAATANEAATAYANIIVGAVAGTASIVMALRRVMKNNATRKAGVKRYYDEQASVWEKVSDGEKS